MPVTDTGDPAPLRISVHGHFVTGGKSTGVREKKSMAAGFPSAASVSGSSNPRIKWVTPRMFPFMTSQKVERPVLYWYRGPILHVQCTLGYYAFWPRDSN